MDYFRFMNERLPFHQEMKWMGRRWSTCPYNFFHRAKRLRHIECVNEAHFLKFHRGSDKLRRLYWNLHPQEV